MVLFINTWSVRLLQKRRRFSSKWAASVLEVPSRDFVQRPVLSSRRCLSHSLLVLVLAAALTLGGVVQFII